jgi:hypothetical protein
VQGTYQETVDTEIKDFLKLHQGRHVDGFTLKDFIQRRVLPNLQRSAEKLLEENERHPFQIAREFDRWSPPGSVTMETEVELMKEWFGEEESMGRLNIPKPEYLSVAHAVIQSIYDKAQKRYHTAKGKREVFATEAKVVWAGKSDMNVECD